MSSLPPTEENLNAELGINISDYIFYRDMDDLKRSDPERLYGTRVEYKLDCIPLDILSYITFYLDIRQLKSLRKINKFFAEKVNDFIYFVLNNYGNTNLGYVKLIQDLHLCYHKMDECFDNKGGLNLIPINIIFGPFCYYGLYISIYREYKQNIRYKYL
eukprot:385486_1